LRKTRVLTYDENGNENEDQLETKGMKKSENILYVAFQAIIEV